MDVLEAGDRQDPPGRAFDDLTPVVDMPHDLSGTFHMSPGEDLARRAERTAHEAARDWFGDRPYRLSIDVHERRAIGGRVLHYKVDYTAAPR